MSQRQHYATNNQQYQQLLSLLSTNCETAIHKGQITQSILCTSNNAANCAQAPPYQAVMRQPYQLGQSQRVYQHAEEKKVYRIDNNPSEELEKDLPDSKTY